MKFQFVDFLRSKENYIVLAPADFIEISRGESIKLNDNLVHHFRNVLRKRRGFDCFISNGAGSLARATVTENYLVTNFSPCISLEPVKPQITIVTPAIKKDRLSLMIQKLTELTVSRIVFFQADFQQHPLPKTERLEKITREAAMQSRNLFLPVLANAAERLTDIEFTDEKVFWGDISSTSSLPVSFASGSLAFILGPEGGFSDREEAYLKNNFLPVCLSYSVLRAETAAMAFAACARANRA